MQLLVSVANAEETGAALAGGADIIDAKDPARGSLGPVSIETLGAIRIRVPHSVPLSVALGDATSIAEVDAAFELVTVPVSFVKLGFAGLQDPARLADLLPHAIRRTQRLPGQPAFIPVAYADAAFAGGIESSQLPSVIQQFSLAGGLVDTAVKKGKRLFDLQRPSRLRAVAARLSAHGGFLAIAGSLGPEDLAPARETGARILGVRGAVCRGGRAGSLSEELVRDLAGRLTAYFEEPSAPSWPTRSSSWSMSAIPMHLQRIPSGSARLK